MKRKVLELLKEKPEDMSGVTEVDGKFYRETEIDDASELKTALSSEREARKALEKKIDNLGDFDPKKYAELLKKEEEGLSDAEKNDRVLGKLRQEIDEMKETHAKELADRDSKLRTHHLDEKSRKAAIKAGVLPDYVDDALAISGKFRTLDDDGKIVIVDKDGDPTGVGLEDFFGKQFKEEKPLYYKGIPGGGGTPSNGGTQMPNKDLMKLPPKERLNAAREQQA